MFHPTRGGTRGGRDQFEWTNVKSDKDREHYLGNSLMAPVGRWIMGRDLQWYSKDKTAAQPGEGKRIKADDEAKRKRDEELAAIKEKESEMLASALGFKTKKKDDAITNKLTKQEIAEATKRGTVGHDEADRVLGVGFGSVGSALLRAKLTNSNQHDQLPGQEGLPAPGDKHDGAAQVFVAAPVAGAVEGGEAAGDGSGKKKKKKDKKEKKEKKHKNHKPGLNSSDDEPDRREPDRRDLERGREPDRREPERGRRHDSPERGRERGRRHDSPDDHHSRHAERGRRHDSPDHERERERDYARDRNRDRDRDRDRDQPRRHHRSRSPERRRHDSP